MNAARALSAIACLMGAAGVSAAAAAGHGGGDLRWSAAAQMLLTHAVSSLVLAGWARDGTSRGPAVAAAGMQAGAILFAADMAARNVWGQALFPMAAPIGGTVLILAWLGAAALFASGLSKTLSNS